MDGGASWPWRNHNGAKHTPNRVVRVEAVNCAASIAAQALTAANALLRL